MEELKNIAYIGICNYFQTLATFGYKSYSEVYKLIVLLFIEDLLRGPLSIYVTECDYRTIANVLYCLFGSTCLIPYPEFVVDTSLVQSLNIETPRISEDSIIRFSEDELIRLVDE